jgi:hypothetical protein
MIVIRSRSFRLIVNVSMVWPGLLPHPGQKGDILIELAWGHSHGVPTIAVIVIDFDKVTG